VAVVNGRPAAIVTHNVLVIDYAQVTLSRGICRPVLAAATSNGTMAMLWGPRDLQVDGIERCSRSLHPTQRSQLGLKKHGRISWEKLILGSAPRLGGRAYCPICRKQIESCGKFAIGCEPSRLRAAPYKRSVY
jgi:hypothetical protein